MPVTSKAFRRSSAVGLGNYNGEDAAPFRLKLWLDRAFALAADINGLAASTIRARRSKLETDLGAILQTPTDCPLGRDLLAKVARAREQLLTFCAFPGEVEATNNACERDLRPSVIQRKITNGHRAKWAADFETAVRTATDTARLAGAGPFQAILQTVAS